MITPISTLDRSQQGHLDFGSSSSEESADAFERNKNHRSLVLRRVSHTNIHLQRANGLCGAHSTVDESLMEILCIPGRATQETTSPAY